MKIQFLSAVVLLLLLGQTTISCNSCEDRNNDPIPPQTPEVGVSASESEDDATLDDGNSTSIDASSTTIKSNSNTTTSTSTTTRVGSATSKTSTKPPRPPKPTYSAPNGTDAENHDGDPYTKHDTTSMPTGTIR